MDNPLNPCKLLLLLINHICWISLENDVHLMAHFCQRTEHEIMLDACSVETPKSLLMCKLIGLHQACLGTDQCSWFSPGMVLKFWAESTAVQIDGNVLMPGSLYNKSCFCIVAFKYHLVLSLENSYLLFRRSYCSCNKIYEIILCMMVRSVII